MIYTAANGLRIIVTERAPGVLEVILDTSGTAPTIKRIDLYLDGKQLAIP